MNRICLPGDLVIDVGMHNGDDTARYLALGFRVVAIEANPALVEAGERRFADEIADGRLRILPFAVAAFAGLVTLTVFDQHLDWSTVDPDFATRGEHAREGGLATRSVQVEARTFGAILDEVGVPCYLKIDIEGNDMLCVEALRGRVVPDWLSVESAATSPVSWLAVIRELAALHRLGYRRFAYVDQSPYPEHTSGGFGHGITGWHSVGWAVLRGLWLHGVWHLFGETGTRRSRRRYARADAAGRWLTIRWYDLHAQTGQPRHTGHPENSRQRVTGRP